MERGEPSQNVGPSSFCAGTDRVIGRVNVMPSASHAIRLVPILAGTPAFECTASRVGARWHYVRAGKTVCREEVQIDQRFLGCTGVSLAKNVT